MEPQAGSEEPLESRRCSWLFQPGHIFTAFSVKYIVLKKNPCYAALIPYFFILKRTENKPWRSKPFSGSGHCTLLIIVDSMFQWGKMYSETQKNLWGVLVRLITLVPSARNDALG